MSQDAAALSPVVPLLFLALAILTASWASSVLAYFSSAPKPQQQQQAQQQPAPKQGKKAKGAAAPIAVAVIPEEPVVKEQDASAFRKVVILAACWAIMLLLLLTGAFGFSQDSTLFDPYAILNVTQDASKAEVKRVFRTLSFGLHPDRLVDKTEAEKAEAGAKFILISKAYKTLTDDEAMKNYLEYGHPDGPRSNSISFGIPAWMLEKENEGLVIFLYLAFFGLVIAAIGKKVVPLLNSLGEEEEEKTEEQKQAENAAAANAKKKY